MLTLQHSKRDQRQRLLIRDDASSHNQWPPSFAGNFFLQPFGQLCGPQ